jgi:hypothetical protein
VATDNDKITIQLLRERCARLEATCAAYDAAIHTPLIDTLRKRNAALESACWGLVDRGVLPAAEHDNLKVTLGNKYTPKY